MQNVILDIHKKNGSNIEILALFAREQCQLSEFELL